MPSSLNRSNAHDRVIAETWLRYHRLRDETDFWAWYTTDALVQDDPERGWNILLLLIAGAEWGELGRVAAGPLEDICQRQALRFLDRIEGQASTDPKFKEALGRIWLNSLYLAPEITQRIVAASGGRVEPFELDYDAAELGEPDLGGA